MLHAVVMGVDAPEDPRIRPLSHACADAEGVAAALRDRVDGERQITLLCGARATKARIARVLTDELPRSVRPEDTVLLYFAGHGSPELEATLTQPSVHLVVHDTEHGRLQATSIDLLTELATWTRRLPARVIAIVLDASFNGLPGGRTFEGPGLWSGPRTRTLDRVSPSRVAVGGRFGLLTACGDKEVAREDDDYKHGIFTHHLIAALRSPELGGRTVSLTMLHGALATHVQRSTNAAQHPALYGGATQAPLFRLDARVAAGAAS